MKAANRNFVLLCRELDLLGGELVAIDGAFFDGNASKASIASTQAWSISYPRLIAISRRMAALDAHDAEEARPPVGMAATAATSGKGEGADGEARGSAAELEAA